jgi:hypothetical protein
MNALAAVTIAAVVLLFAVDEVVTAGALKTAHEKEDLHRMNRSGTIILFVIV